MSMSLKITGLQRVEAALSKQVKKLQGREFVTVGIHESAGQHKDSEDTVATIGARNHFGIGVSARPWLDVGVASGKSEYGRALKNAIENNEDSRTILNRIGILAVGATQQYITDLDTPPNSPETIVRKGSSNPLIDTGQMRASVTHKIVRKKPEEGL